jgi:hypothetical protein
VITPHKPLCICGRSSSQLEQKREHLQKRGDRERRKTECTSSKERAWRETLRARPLLGRREVGDNFRRSKSLRFAKLLFFVTLTVLARSTAMSLQRHSQCFREAQRATQKALDVLATKSKHCSVQWIRMAMASSNGMSSWRVSCFYVVVFSADARQCFCSAEVLALSHSWFLSS